MRDFETSMAVRRYDISQETRDGDDCCRYLIHESEKM